MGFYMELAAAGFPGLFADVLMDHTLVNPAFLGGHNVAEPILPVPTLISFASQRWA